MKKIIFLILIVLAAVALTAALLFFKSFKNKKALTDNNIPTQTVQPALSLEDVQKEIPFIINSKNFDAITQYMNEPTVEVTIKSTECCIFSPPEQAAVRLAYITEGIPMDFDQNNSRIVDLKSKYKELAGTFIGISKEKGHLIAFYFDKENEIASVTMAVDSKIFGFNEQPTGQP